MTIAKHLTISGRVQGVFYRDWTVKTAGELGLAGWVRNCPDGTVEAQVEGNEEAVQRFIALAEQGPPAAEVERIEARETAGQDLSGFRKRADGSPCI